MLIHLIPPYASRYRANALDPERHQSANQQYLDDPGNQSVGRE